MKNIIFSIYEASNVTRFLNPTANTVGYINYTPTELLKNTKNIKNTVIASEKRNKNNPMRLALGKASKNKLGFVRSQIKIKANKKIKEAKCN